MLPDMRHVSTGLVVAIVGFFGTFPIVVQGLLAVGACPAQASAGLMASAMAMGLAAIGLSLFYRMPVSIAWSTPGAALLAVSAAPQGGFSTAIGAFMIAGVLTLAAGLVRPLGRAAAAIPANLAQAMLAGVLLPRAAAATSCAKRTCRMPLQQRNLFQKHRCKYIINYESVFKLFNLHP